MSAKPGEVYLGDGLYASYDGWQIGLRAPRGMDGDHKVFLEPPVMQEFLRFATNCGMISRVTPPSTGDGG